jgi:hypothetical protein
LADNTAVTSASNLKTVEQLAQKRAELQQLRNSDMRDWALNRAFYNSNQWVFWNRISSQVETLPVLDGEKPRWKVRLTSNQIKPGVNHYVAQLTKTRPVIQASPDSGSYRDRAAAEMATTLFDWWWAELTLKSKLQTALIDSTISQGWWKITWDPLAGKSMKVIYDPEGQPITDNELADAYRDQLVEAAQQMGQDPKEFLAQYEKTMYVGDLDVEAVPGENILIDPVPTDYTKATYAICKHSMDVDEIKARYGVTVQPNCSTEGALPLFMSKRPEDRPKTARDVYIGYFRPTPLKPKGRYVVWIEEPNQILADTPWPYPFNELPLVKFPGVQKPASALDEPLVTDARPLQKELNRTLSQIIQHKDLTIKPQMIAPLGSLRQRLTDEPGAIFEYQPIQGLMPEWRQTPSLPNSTIAILEDIQGRIKEHFNYIPSGRDSMPARVDAGYSIELLQEAVADQLSPIIQRMEEALARAGKLMVLLAQEYYQEPRLLKIRGDSGSVQVRKFVNADLAGGFSFAPESGTGLPRSRAGRTQRIIELVNAGLMDPKQAQRHLDLADLKGIQAQFAANEDMSYREHELLIKGQPINQVAIAQAQQQIQQMIQQAEMPPQPGQPPVDPQQLMMQAQQMMQQAANAPTDFEDWETHLNVHGLFMSSPEFTQLPLDAQQRFVDHWTQTYQRIMGAKQAQMALDPRVAPKVGLNFRATTSAPAATQMLDRVGVHVDPDVLAGPPLDTAVFDMLSDPSMQDTANTHADLAMKAQQMQQAQDQHDLATAKTVHQSSLAQSQAVMQQQAQAQQMDHAEQAHQDKLSMTRQQALQRQRQQDEMHQVKKQQAAKPKPANGGNR